MNILKTIFLLIVICQAQEVIGQNESRQIVIKTGEEKYAIEDYSKFYFDDYSKMDAIQAFDKYRAYDFKQLTTENLNFTHSIGTVWLAIEIENTTNSSLYLNFRNFFLQKITVYTKVNNQIQSSKVTGASLPFHTKDFRSGGYIIEIPSSNITGKHLVMCAIKIDESAPTFVRGELGDLKSVLNYNRFHESLTMTILGILLVMLFYNASLFTVTRDRLYFYYSGYLTSSILIVAWFNGLLFEWFWPNNPNYNKYPWPMAIYFITQLVFISQMLRINTFLPKVRKICMSFISISLIILITSFTNITLSSILIFSFAIILPLYYVFLILRLAKLKEKIIYIFLLGWTPMLIVTVFNSIMTVGFIKYTEIFGLHGVEVCLAWEVVIFSLALGYRYNLIKQQIISVQDENLNIIENQKLILEQMVSERTEEILAQNEALIKNQDQIQIQNERLESQNRAYEKLRELVLRQNQNLESAVNKRTIELADSNQELKNNLRKIERFNFIAAHNLRGPVARILGLCMLVEKEEPIKDSINYEIIEKLKYSTRELDIIIHDLILVLDIQSQNDKNYKRINPEESIQKILKQFQNELKKENFILEFNISAETINVIPEYFDNIFINLISNSLKYRSFDTDNKISITIEKNENNVVINYKDKGVGFESANYEDKIFEPFQKFHSNSDGKGLGLFLIKSQIRAMGGEINLRSKPNMGINITIQLPDIKNPKKNSGHVFKTDDQLNKIENE
ncbi:multi-sensor signal transduction multi-kinase [Chryseotalea sanaruensis]|uniref:histidine kinase n=1 Tax=Chryseotalea sanaruensis TaxID=2482724 RepID=A0A401UAI2_9BACT|nr:sensor histidine kinase [Chryseotalea sanaruensis]GCC51895.1 multi-sensor signal transduction multi-kinase [Chryseotalea sanaruensis]